MRTNTLNTPIQNRSSLSDTLKARKSHLIALLQIIDIKADKRTEIQTLTTNAIKSEIDHIELRLRKKQ